MIFSFFQCSSSKDSTYLSSHIQTELRIGFKTRRTSNGFGAERKSGFYSILFQKSALLKGS